MVGNNGSVNHSDCLSLLLLKIFNIDHQFTLITTHMHRKISIISFMLPAIVCCFSYCMEKKTATTSQSLPMFPTMKAPHNEFLQALLTGRLVLSGDCLSVGDKLIVWPYGYTVKSKEGVISIFNEKDKQIANVGDTFELSGGQAGESVNLKEQVEGYIPGRCSGPIWMVGEVNIKDR